MARAATDAQAAAMRLQSASAEAGGDARRCGDGCAAERAPAVARRGAALLRGLGGHLCALAADISPNVVTVQPAEQQKGPKPARSPLVKDAVSSVIEVQET